MEFDLQRFAEDGQPVADTPSEPAAETSTEPPATEEQPLPEELNGIPEDIARETLAEWEATKPQEEPQPEAGQAPPEEKPVTREDYEVKVKEAEQLKAQLAQYQAQLAQYQQQATQPQAQQPRQQAQVQQPQFKLTPEISARISEAIKAEAMTLTGMSADDVESLKYADDDDPRLPQWRQANSIAQNRVYNALQQGQIAQRQQAQQFYNAHMEALHNYNEFAAKALAEPDFKEIQNFAANEFFEQLPPNAQKVIANSYLRVERQTASPAEMLLVENYFDKARAVYRTRNAKPNKQSKPAPAQQAATLPRADQLQGAAGKGEITVAELERMLETTDFDKIPKQYQDKLLGIA